MQKQLEALRLEFDRATAHVQALRSRLSDAQWLQSHDNYWSALQCIEHLNLTSQAFIPLLTEALSQAPKVTTAKYHLDLIGWLLLRSQRSQSKMMRSKTPGTFVPPKSLDIAKTLDQFDDYQKALISLLEKSEGKAIGKVKVRSAFNDKIRYNVYSAFRCLAVHEERHLRQAEQAIAGH